MKGSACSAVSAYWPKRGASSGQSAVTRAAYCGSLVVASNSTAAANSSPGSQPPVVLPWLKVLGAWLCSSAQT